MGKFVIEGLDRSICGGSAYLPERHNGVGAGGTSKWR
jgi:hypothetical protein